MEKRYFISPSKANALISETMTGSSVIFEGRTYSEITRAPKGRRIMKKLVNLKDTLKLVIYS